MSSLPSDITRLLNLAAQGDHAAADAVLPAVVRELRDLANARLARLPAGQTLQPTALVNEVWLRLADGGATEWEGRRHFYFVAARAMRDVLVEVARRKGAAKRGGERQRVTIDEAHLVIESPTDDIVALDRALERLEEIDAQGVQIVMLRFFTGLDVDETARALEVSKSTVERKWRFVRAWLKKELDAGD
ncbi:MAG TPA: ECF-type sigma factor [Candidatus Krumholzibacteria bacterium]|jgi:RNA polymerase sigma factor (TIGR02999 family)|nr:ECF-type sigma factor [Candidatus Krumholzibacteria bacterium]